MLTHKTQLKPIGHFAAIGLFLLFFTQASHGQPIVYDWVPDSGISTGFLEFDDAAITDPKNFTTNAVVGGQFNFNESPFVDVFDILAPFSLITPPTIDSFQAVAGHLILGKISVLNLLYGNNFVLDVPGPDRRVHCRLGSSGIPAADGCGGPSGDEVETTGSWVYRQPQATPEPTVTMYLTAGLIGLVAAIRRQRRNARDIGERSVLPTTP